MRYGRGSRRASRQEAWLLEAGRGFDLAEKVCDLAVKAHASLAWESTWWPAVGAGRILRHVVGEASWERQRQSQGYSGALNHSNAA